MFPFHGFDSVYQAVYRFLFRFFAFFLSFSYFSSLSLLFSSQNGATLLVQINHLSMLISDDDIRDFFFVLFVVAVASVRFHHKPIHEVVKGITYGDDATMITMIMITVR